MNPQSSCARWLQQNRDSGARPVASGTCVIVWLLLTGCEQGNDDRFRIVVRQVRDELSSSIDIRETPLADESLVAELNGLSALKDLNLDRSPVTNAGLMAIGSLPALEKLSLSRTQISNEGTKTIVTNFPSLVFLRLDETVVTDAGIDALSDLPALQELSLFGGVCPIGVVNRLGRWQACGD